jgi:hypothetical protein
MPETGERQRLSSGDENGKQRRSSSSGKKRKTKKKKINFSCFFFLASEDRASMVIYWKRNSNPNLESMMLDTNADKINRFEYPEILECLPDLDGKSVLELGAGIG